MNLKLSQPAAIWLVALASVFVALFSFSQSGRESISEASLPDASQLIAELGCATCHSGLPKGDSLRFRAPALHYAGQKYTPSYLFEYLQNPVKIRQNIGHSRMPDFGLSPEESLALTLYLSEQKETDRQWPTFPTIADLEPASTQIGNVENGKRLLTEMGCVACHTLEKEGQPHTIDLALGSRRLRPEWVKRLLVAPYVYTSRLTDMPAFFYHLSPDSTAFKPNLPDAAERIRDITAYLFSLDETAGTKMKAAYRDFVRSNSGINAEMGGRIFAAQNCVACHQGPDEASWRTHNAPDLAAEGSRVRKEWLTGYLHRPSAIRPAGFYTGSGSRMPDFRLSDEEVRILSEFLMNQKASLEPYSPKSRSRFSQAKASSLIQMKLPCLGCHQLDGKGGWIGPSLNSVSKRLQPAYIREMIRNPHKLSPESIMPKIPMPESTLDLLTDFLLQNHQEHPTPEYFSWIDQPLFLIDSKPENAELLYQANCAACHGLEGDGQGFNAFFLEPKPTVHANAEYMSERPDDTLFDGIYSGGYILDKSQAMPPWGQTLSTSEISSLVKYMRELCACEGPEWTKY